MVQHSCHYFKYVLYFIEVFEHWCCTFCGLIVAVRKPLGKDVAIIHHVLVSIQKHTIPAHVPETAHHQQLIDGKPVATCPHNFTQDGVQACHLSFVEALVEQVRVL